MQYQIRDTELAERVYTLDGESVHFRDHMASASPAVAYRLSRTNDRRFVVEGAAVPFNPHSWAMEKRLIWSGRFASANGFGSVAENTVKELLRRGIAVSNPDVISGPLILGAEFVDEAVQSTVRLLIEPDCLEVQHCQPWALKLNIVERIWTYTMFETDHMPRRWLTHLAGVERILVPSRWLLESFAEQGVRRPLSVYGHGVDPAVHRPIERPGRETYTFLHYGQLSDRKGTDLVLRAFAAEFAGRRDARLILKNTHAAFPVPRDVAGVEYIGVTYSKEEMRALMGQADCAVFPTRGEGFGLPPLEAMATGLPAIVTGWSGPLDYADPRDTLLLDYRMTRAHYFDEYYKDSLEPGEDAGRWAEPDLDHLRAQMRWCYEHREAAAGMGMAAAERVARDWTWEKKVGELLEIIDTAL